MLVERLGYVPGVCWKILGNMALLCVKSVILRFCSAVTYCTERRQAETWRNCMVVSKSYVFFWPRTFVNVSMSKVADLIWIFYHFSPRTFGKISCLTTPPQKKSENQWLVQMKFPFEIVPFLGTFVHFRWGNICSGLKPSTPRGNHQLHVATINSTWQPSTPRGNHQLHVATINSTWQPSTPRGNHQLHVAKSDYLMSPSWETAHSPKSSRNFSRGTLDETNPHINIGQIITTKPAVGHLKWWWKVRESPQNSRNIQV